MELWNVVAALSPYVRFRMATIPFFAAILLRFVFGGNKFTRWFISIASMWFLVNVLLAPYSPSMRDDLRALVSIFQ